MTENISKLREEINRLKGLKWKRAQILKTLGITNTAYNYARKTDEEFAQHKEYQKQHRLKRIKEPHFHLRQRVVRFMTRGCVCTKPFTAQDVVDKFGPNPVCYLTGAPIEYTTPESYQLDHIIPCYLNGSGNLDNLQLCAPMANNMKNQYLLDEFLDMCEKIAKRKEEIKRIIQNPTDFSRNP